MLLSIFLIGMLCSNTTAPIQFPEQLLEQVTVIVFASEAEKFSQVVTKPLKSLPYDTPGQIFGAFEKPEVVPAVGKFSNMLRFTVKEVQKIHSMFERRDTRSLCRSPTYTTLFSYLAYLVILPGWLIQQLVRRRRMVLKMNTTSLYFSLAVLWGCKSAPLRRKKLYTFFLYIGNVRVLVHIAFGIDGLKEVAIKLGVRSEHETVSDAIHEILASG